MGEYASFSALHCFNLILGHCIFLAFYLPQQPLSTAELKFYSNPLLFSTPVFNLFLCLFMSILFALIANHQSTLSNCA
ncbi:hypothetical protein BN341_4710 [Helicobacter heilmannii ASB1.4]|uniref:Uncharacterized protein n=1 Tax=Helicobacter heilmannii TaxID=35817 RepID=A0A0K2Y7W3_HELHE|nr:hypothetical protein BN341_4710 [Helicobacter heilmannii ASB1.4]CRI34207.1 hypothetical protein HHE01_10530 [Helicobacter heilmannii]